METEKKQKKRNSTRKGNVLLHILLHISLVAAAVLAVVVLVCSYVAVDTKKGTMLYRLDGEGSGSGFEESGAFDQILGNSITDIICFGAIRGQMETEGEFDTKKVVDVTAFAGRYSGLPSEYITADYYLDDLIKWSQNGFEYSEVAMTAQQADQFLQQNNRITYVNLNAGVYNGGTVSYLNSDLEGAVKVKDVSGNSLMEGGSGREDCTATILKNRYHTVEGKNIEDYVADWEEYYDLCSHLTKAADDLATNYEEYLKYQELYGAGKSNVVYFIRKTIGDQVIVYTNMNTKSKELQALKKQLAAVCGKYVYYDPAGMKYDTNTKIEEATLRYVLNGYEYAYPEDTQVMIGVDLSYPVKDNFSKGNGEFERYVPNRIQYVGGAVSFALLYVLLMVLLTKQEGVVGQKETGELIIRLHKEDRIFTEVMILLACGIGVLLAKAGGLLANEITGETRDSVILLLTACASFLISLFISFFYFSFVRRWKAGTLWKNSLLRKGGQRLIKWIGVLYANGGAVLRVWLPFGVFVLLNGLFLSLLFGDGGKASKILIFLLLLLFDGICGAILYRSAVSRKKILYGIRKINEGDLEQKIEEQGMYGDDLVMARAVNHIGDSVRAAVETSMKDERLKADLITNVSHDIKTPLTSIINYVDLIKRENISDPKIREYIEVLDTKSQRLKQLTDDLVEASKISSGNIVLQWEKINLVELLNQTIGEFSEKFGEKALIPVLRTPQNVICILADSRRIWRVVENLFNNICKYALEGTRVYIDLELLADDQKEQYVRLSIKNISEKPLKVQASELTERFIRGDESRTTEGSGLGLSIAKNLTEIQKGKFEIAVDGDLFKVNLTFPLLTEIK